MDTLQHSESATVNPRWVLALSDEVANPTSPAYVAIELTPQLNILAGDLRDVLERIEESFIRGGYKLRAREAELSFPAAVSCVVFDDVLPDDENSGIFGDELRALTKACDHLSLCMGDDEPNEGWVLLPDNLAWEALWIQLCVEDPDTVIRNDPQETILTSSFHGEYAIHHMQMLLEDGRHVRVSSPLTGMLMAAGFPF
jgi:hypothetical protein